MTEKQPDWIFVLWGQSNMAGRGEVLPEDREPIPGILSWSDLREKWVPATDPLFNDKPQIAGTGLARIFATRVREAFPDVTIGFVPSAIGGTKLEAWVPGAQLYLRALAQYRRALRKSNGTLKGLLWHQGEGDSGREETAYSYAERFANMVETARKDLEYPDLPVVLGELGPFLADRETPRSPFCTVVDEQLRQAGKEISQAICVTSQGCGHIGDQLHFNREGVHILGERYAQAWLDLYRGK